MTRNSATPGKQAPAGRTAVPEKQAPAGRTAVPEKAPVGQVAVPDRPTTGAPTRYTHLQSGQLARAASHVVKQGDSLWGIARANLGGSPSNARVAGEVKRLWDLNDVVIGTGNPDLIMVGQRLKLR